MWGRARVAVTLLACVAALAACRPLYLPLVPDDGLPAPHPTRLAGGSALKVGLDGRPLLDVEVLDVPAAGWLAVQWLAPDGREAASESAWVEPPNASLTFVLPDDVPLRPGEWRAVVSYGSLLLRQFSLAF